MDRLTITSGVYYNQNLQRELTLAEIIEDQGLDPDTRTDDYTLGNLEGTKFTYHSHGVGHYVTEIYLVE